MRVPRCAGSEPAYQRLPTWTIGEFDMRQLRLPGLSPSRSEHLARPAARPWYAAHARLLIAICAALLLIADALALAHTIQGNPYWRNSIDFSVYTRAAAGFAHGQNPYVLSFYTHGSGSIPIFYGVLDIYDIYVYPPFFAEVLWPVVAVSDALARFLWISVSVAALASSMWMLLRRFGTQLSWQVISLIFGLVCATYVARNDLYHGQVNFFLLWLLTLGLFYIHRGRAIGAGVAWGLLFVVKPFFGILVLYLLWRRQWRTAFISIATAGSLLLVSFVPTFLHGSTVWQSWVQISRTRSSDALVASRPDNLSIHGLLLRLFHDNLFTTPLASNSSLLSLSEVFMVVLGIVLLVLVLGWPLSHSDRTHGVPLLLDVGCTLGISMAIGPLTEGDHLMLLIPCLVGVLIFAHGQAVRETRTAALWLSTAAAWAVIFLIRSSPWRLGIGVADGASWRHLSGLPILLTGQYGLLLLAASALLAAALAADRRPGAIATQTRGVARGAV